MLFWARETGCFREVPTVDRFQSGTTGVLALLGRNYGFSKTLDSSNLQTMTSLGVHTLELPHTCMTNQPTEMNTSKHSCALSVIKIN